MEVKKIRRIVFFKEYFEEFYRRLPRKAKDKFVWTFQLIEEVERVPDKYLKYVHKGIYEVRVKYGSNVYRAFGFFDGNQLVIVMNGFVKKTQKTPKNELKKASKIKMEYEKAKKEDKIP